MNQLVWIPEPCLLDGFRKRCAEKEIPRFRLYRDKIILITREQVWLNLFKNWSCRSSYCLGIVMVQREMDKPGVVR